MRFAEISSTLEALGHPSRLAIVACLANEKTGLSAGEISSRLEIAKSTLSGQLKILMKSNILMSDRQGRHIIYAFDVDGFSLALSKFLSVVGPQVTSRICH